MGCRVFKQKAIVTMDRHHSWNHTETIRVSSFLTHSILDMAPYISPNRIHTARSLPNERVNNIYFSSSIIICGQRRTFNDISLHNAKLARFIYSLGIYSMLVSIWRCCCCCCFFGFKWTIDRDCLDIVHKQTKTLT